MSFILELCQFMQEQRKFWLLPLFVIILAFGTVIILANGSALAPFLYAIF